MSSSSSALSPLEALKAGFRRACVRRLVGDEEGAIQVLKDEIPALVVGWAKVSDLEPSQKKAKLKEMFDDESARADELATAFDLFAGRFETRLASLIREELGGVVAQVQDLVKQVSLSPAPENSQNPLAVEKSEPVKEAEELTEEVIEEVEDEKLDPLRGMGLKFDEIEKMIDEVLAFEKDS
tara:strand:+ start:348 stop:893 length:546 start_codon:yes stop_codon:yes gene_type:complete